ncbi:type III pantothenate kinase [Candidatus Omnitrophota bacterium]
MSREVNMLLAVDIGNTSIYNGIFKGRILSKAFRTPTNAKDLKSQYIKRMKPCLKGIERVVVGSVVPEALKCVRKLVRDTLGKEILVVGEDVDSGVKNLYKKPRQVGQDRLINARAAYELHGGPSIIVDFGTAITIDVINKKKEYLGGVITPGVEISLGALSAKACLLPKVAIKKPEDILGKETRQSMISGAVYGFSSLCDGIVQRLKKKCCKGCHVVATGGLSRLIGPYCKTVDIIDPELTLKGLALIGDENSV